MEKQTRRNVKGITLMALVITVIVLLILSGIGVAMLSGDNGIINRSVNAKDSAAVKSEMRIVEVSSNSAREKNKYGLVEEEKLKNELKATAGEGKTEVTPYDNGSHFLITFLDTNRVYEVDNEEGVKYLGALNDVVNTGILTANPKRDKTPTKEHRTIKISLKTINEIPDEDVEVYYTWVKKKTQEIETSDLKLIEEFKGDTNDRTIKSGTVSTGELEDDGKWYLYVEARIKDGETVTEYFGDYVVGEPVIVADMGFVRYDYEKNGGSGCNRSSDQVAYGTTVALKGSGSNTATRTGGWEFVGWTTDEYGTVPIDSVEVNEQNNNIVVYAIFKKNLTLKFYDASHGTNPVEKTTTIYNNNTTGKLSSSNVPSIGSYNGWTVGYWTPSTNPNGRRATDDNGNIVASGATNYYAIYTKEVTVEYNLNGGTGTNITSETGTAKVNSFDLNEVEGASIDLPDADVTKTGYTFNGWNTKADGTGVHYNKNGVGKFAEEITLYAEWGANSYSIKFDKNSESATGTMSNLAMVYGTEKQLTQNAYSWTGYTFNGWNTKADGTGAHFTDKQSVNNLAISGTITIYAQWTPNTYTISYDYAGGTGGTNKPTSGTYDTDIQISNPTKTGYTFAGWTSSSSDGLGETAKTGTAANPSTEWTGTATKNTYFRNLTDTNNGTVKLTATWTSSTYTVEYYQGNNSTTAGSTKFATTSSHTFGTAKALTTYATLGGTAPSGWTFAGWSTSQTGTSVSTVNSVSLTDGASVTNLTNTANGTVKLYAIFKRNVIFKSGASAGTTDATKEQRYNPYKTTGYITSVTSPSALTAITGWTNTGTGTGYRNDATAGAATIGFSASVTPAYNATALTYYGVYTKVINVYSGVSKGTNNSQTQYLNTNGNKVSSISLAVPTPIDNWEAIGYRDDTTADDKETAVTTSAVSITPAYSTSAISYYAVYSRTLTIKYNGNEATSGSTESTTKAVYLNTNSTTTSSQQVTLANNGFIKNGYMFNKWAKGSTSGTKYSAGASYTARLAYNSSSFEVTMYAIWQDVYLRTSEASTDGTEAKFLYTTIERRKIKSVTFANSIAGHTVDGTTCFDVSSISNSKQVLLWITNTDENGYVDIVIGQNGGVKANPNSYQLFSYVGYTPSTFTIDFTNFDTSSVTNMNNMFSYCGYTAMTSLDLGDNFDTSSVTTMYGMFYCCGKAMTSIDLGEKFDTSNVTDMHSMFVSCGRTAMTSLDLGDKFDTSKVTDMWSMFSYCGYSAMTSLDLGDKFDTSKVTDMGNMFQYCGYTAMTSLDLGDKFDTSSVTKMARMFQCCGYKAMTSLDLGEKFNTSKVTNMSSMFDNCGYTAMTSLDLGEKFDTSSVTNMIDMFHSCGYKAMTSLDLGDKFDTSKVENMCYMFCSCGYTSMTSLDLGDNFDTSNVTKMISMFEGCGYKAMTSLDLGDKFDTSNVTSMSLMFEECGHTAMTSLDLGDKFDTSSVTNIDSMFRGCGYTAMTSLDLGDNFDTSSTTNMASMFQECGYTSMTSLDLGNKFDTSKVTNMSHMFSHCGHTAMTSLDLGDKFDTSSVTNMDQMFYNCPNLVTIYATESFVTTNVTNGNNMFTYDTKLVGGMGTTFDSNHIDQAYAHLDLGTTNPGYFTDKRTYYVEFDANEGTGTMARQVMTYGESSNLTTNTFTRTGYIFAGWNTEEDGSGTSYTNGQSVLNLENGWKKVKKLYAQWTANSYTISYDYAGGTGGTNKPTSGAYDTDVQISNPTKTGYTFAGWTSSSSDGLGTNAKTGTAANPSTTWTGTATKNTYFKSLTDTNNGTVKLTATWSVNYKLKKVIGASNLIANGGFGYYSLTDAPSKTANGVTHTWDKDLNGVPGNTSKAYSMTSWSYNGTGANMGVAVPEIGYHAHMRRIDGNSVVRFKTNEDYAGKTAANVSDGVSVTPGTISANRWLGVSQQLTGTDLTAGATYVVTLDAYRVSGTQKITGGLYYEKTNSNTEKDFYSGQYSFNPTKTGEWETFSWTFTLSSDYLNTTNPSFYIYGYTGGTGEIYVDNVRLEQYDNTKDITKGYDLLYTTEELSAVSKSGYSFDGWYSDARYTKRLDETEQFNTNTAVFEDVNTPETSAYIYAKWKANTYTISYDYAGGTEGTNAPTSATYNTDVQISNPTRTGYTFAGWKSSTSDGLGANAKTGTAASPSTAWTGAATKNTYFKNLTDTNNGTVKLTATWTVNQYKITYDYNVNNYTYHNDSFIDTNYTINWDEDFEIDSVVNIPTLGQRYLIAGNFYTTSSTSKDISLEITTGNKLRVWINGDQRGASTATIAAGTDITFHFSWVASTKKYTFTSTGTNSNVTVTGTYDVTGSANKTLRQGMKDHRESGAAYKTMTTKSLKITKKHKYSTSLSNLPSAATKTGYTLNGWFTSATGGTKVSTSTTVPAENKTYYAQWEIRKYTLTVNPNGGTWNGKTTNTTVTQNYDTTYKVTNNPTRAGYLFTGWTLSGNGNYSYYDTSVTPTETKTFNYNSASSTVPTVYNNSGGGTVTDSMVADSTATGKYSLKVTTNGTATPGAGGVHVDAWPTTSGRINVLEVKAKIPTGYSLLLSGIGEVYTGIGANYRYNDNAGTGAWKTYYLVNYSGDTGSFSPTSYLYLSGTNNKSVTWNINSIVMKSYTKSQFKTIYKFGIGNGTLTANWAVSGSKVTFNSNNGKFNTAYVKNWTNGYNGASATSAYRCYYYGTAYGTYPGDSNYNWTPDSRVISREGYIFDGWYTATSEGTKIFNKNGTLVSSVSGYSDSSSKWIKYDGNVTLYARWIQASYEVSSPSTYTTTIKDAIEVADSGATIKFLLTSKADHTTANINKTLTLDLNGGTLTRNVPINVTAGNFTIKGSADGSSKGTLVYDNTTDSSAIMNTGASSSVTIQSKTDLRSKAVGIRFGTGVTNGSLNISNSYVHSEGAYSAIRIGRANVVNISDSYIFSPYGYPGTIYVDVLPSLIISGKSRVGGGTTQDSNSSSARGTIVFSLAQQDTTTKLTLNGNAILMAGDYCKQAVLANRKINVDILGEAEVYSNNGPCFTHWVSESIININTSGWVYANGSYVVAAGTNSIDVNLSRGTLVAQTQYMVYGGGTGKFISQTNTHNHDFYVMNAYNSYSTKQFSNLYEYGLGFVKVGHSSSYVWTYQDVTRKHGWNDIHGYRYYFWDSTKSNAEQHLAAEDKTQYLDGQLVTKWLYVNGGWYYLTPSDNNADPVSSTHGRMHTEHLYLGTNHYFLAPSYNFTTYKNKELSGIYTFNYGQMVYGYLLEYKGDGPWWFDPADGVSR